MDHVQEALFTCLDARIFFLFFFLHHPHFFLILITKLCFVFLYHCIYRFLQIQLNKITHNSTPQNQSLLITFWYNSFWSFSYVWLFYFYLIMIPLNKNFICCSFFIKFIYLTNSWIPTMCCSLFLISLMNA